MTNTSTFLHLFQIYFNSSQAIECTPHNIRRKTYTNQALFCINCAISCQAFSGKIPVGNPRLELL